jgi:FAD/FMN-containing dehydrogenase
VDTARKEAVVAGGATCAEVSTAAGAYGLAAVAANIGAVGMAGLLLGGGYGPLTPRFGLAADNLVGAEVVLADGRLVQADETQNAELFWALRGGGGNFGVVTSLRLRLHPIGALLAGVILFPWSDVRSVLRGYAEIMSSASDELSLVAGLSTGPEGEPVALLGPVWSGDETQGRAVMARLQSFGRPFATKIAPMTCSDLLGHYDAQVVGGRHYVAATNWLGELAPDVISALIAAYDNRTSPFSMVTLHHFHGAGARVAPDATAFGMRRQHFTSLVYGSWAADADHDAARHRRWVSDLSARLAPLALPGGYANLLAPDAHKQIAAAYGGNARRLSELKRKYDPENVFSSAIPLPS